MKPGRVQSFLFEKTYSLLLVLLVGSLGSHLVDLITGEGFFVQKAEAARMHVIPAEDLRAVHFELNPQNPGKIQAFHFSLNGDREGEPDHLHITFDADENKQYLCSLTPSVHQWTCSIGDLDLATVEAFKIFSHEDRH